MANNCSLKKSFCTSIVTSEDILTLLLQDLIIDIIKHPKQTPTYQKTHQTTNCMKKKIPELTYHN
jgi:hypothetical protein